MRRDKYKIVDNMSDPKSHVILEVTNTERENRSDSPQLGANDRYETRSANPGFDRLLKAFIQNNLEDARAAIDLDLDINYQEPMLKNRTGLMFAAKYDFPEGGHLLLERGANPSLCDVNGVTALHLAASKSNFEFVRELLRIIPDPDPRDSQDRTPLHYAAKSFTEENKVGCLVVKELLKAGAQAGAKDADDRVPLHSVAYNGNASLLLILLKYSVPVSPRDKEGLTPLHLSVIGGRSIKCVQILLQFDATVDAKDEAGKTPLHLVSGRSINYVDEEFDASCLALLLRNGASVVDKDDEGYNALSLALQKTMWWGRQTPRDSILRIVQLLVAKGSPITDCFAMWRIVDTFPSMVMVALNQSIKVSTSAKDSPYLKVKMDMRALMNNEKLSTGHNKSIILSNIPNADMSIPAPLRSNAELSMLNYIIRAGHRNILRHPLCSSFLHLKWLKVRKLFLFNIVFYLLFVITLTCYLTNMKLCASQVAKESSEEKNSSEIFFPGEERFRKNSDSSDEEKQEFSSDKIKSSEEFFELIRGQSEMWITLSMFTLLFLCKECLQFAISPVLYLKNYETYLDVTLLVCMVPVLQWSMNDCLLPWVSNLTCVVAIVSWSRLMMLLGHFPAFGVYIVMFSTVCTSIVKFLVIYLPLLIAFALGFLMLLRGIPPFANFQTALVSSVVMMTGEIEYGDKILTNSNLYSKIFPCLILVLFLLLVYIILSNLLVGLAVSDMSAIQKRSELLRLTRQVELMVQVENFFNNYFFPKWLQRWLRRKFSICQGKEDVLFVLHPNMKLSFHEKLFNALDDVISNRPLLAKIFELFINGFIIPEKEPSLPSDLVEEATNIALTELEIQKRDNLEIWRTQQGKSVKHKKNMQKRFSITPQLQGLSQHRSRAYSSNDWLQDPDVEMLLSGQRNTDDGLPTPSLRASFWRASFRKEAETTSRGLEETDVSTDNVQEDIASLKESIKSLQATVENLSWRLSSK